MIKDDLEIFLITYNGGKYLEETFSQIFAETSPIKDFDITILDNKSTDGTTAFIDEYIKQFPNVKHVVNNRNIGGNANFVKACEIATKKYFWVLCDDDEFNFAGWGEVENAIKANYDAIVVANYTNPKKDVAHLVSQMTFVPSTIYKTEILTTAVLHNAEFNISNMFPQFALAAKVINESLKLYIINCAIVKMLPHRDESSYIRGCDDDIDILIKKMYWEIGFANSLWMIKNDEIRNFIIDNVEMDGLKILRPNKFCYKCFRQNKEFVKNFSDYFAVLNLKNKLFFLFELFIHSVVYKLVYPYANDE